MPREYDVATEAEEMPYHHKRALDGEALAHLHRRMDTNREILGETREMMIEIREMLTRHIEIEAETAPAIKELVTIWRGSKLMLPIVMGAVALFGALGGLVVWLKDHVK